MIPCEVKFEVEPFSSGFYEYILSYTIENHKHRIVIPEEDLKQLPSVHEILFMALDIACSNIFKHTCTETNLIIEKCLEKEILTTEDIIKDLSDKDFNVRMRHLSAKSIVDRNGNGLTFKEFHRCIEMFTKSRAGQLLQIKSPIPHMLTFILARGEDISVKILNDFKEESDVC